MPRYETPSTEWPNREIIWKITGPEVRKQLIRTRIASGAHYIFREVGLAHPDFAAPFDEASIDGILTDVETEFDVLNGLGIKVPAITWKVFHRDHQVPKVVAKVGVIEGYTPSYLSPEAHMIREAMQAYFSGQRQGRRLYDIDSAAQYVIGTSRACDGESAEQPALHLIDIEPRLA